MNDPESADTPPIHTAGSIAQLLGGEVRPPEAADVRIRGVESIEAAGSEDITFVTSESHARLFAESRAAAAIIATTAVPDSYRDNRPLVIVPDAELALIRVLELFAPPSHLPESGMHPSAIVHESVTVGMNARIGPHVSIDRNVVIGANAVIHPGVRIYPETRIGDDCTIHANAVIRERSVLGDRVILHQNVSIGADGFGYRPGPPASGPSAGHGRSNGENVLHKMPHVGHVVIEDDVEIGANTCVDRGKFSATTIGAGTKIDNLVQIAHNCRIGRNCVIAGMAGLAGSVRVGDWVQIGAQVGVTEGLTIGSGARIGGKSGVMNDVAPGETVYGIPAYPRREALRLAAALRKLPEMLDRRKTAET